MEMVVSIVCQRYGLNPIERMENLDVNAAIWGYIYVRHSSSCSSSWYRLYGEFEIYPESIPEIIETVVSCDSEGDH